MNRTASSRSVLIRLAAALPKGSKERRAVLARVTHPSGWTVLEDGKAYYEDRVGHYKFIKVHTSRFQDNKTRWLVTINWSRKDYETFEGIASGWPNIREAVTAAEKALEERMGTLKRFHKGIEKLRTPLMLAEAA